MASTAITVEVDEGMLAAIDDLVEYMGSKSLEFGVASDRSDAILLCVTGYLVEHDAGLQTLMAEARSDGKR